MYAEIERAASIIAFYLELDLKLRLKLVQAGNSFVSKRMSFE